MKIYINKLSLIIIFLFSLLLTSKAQTVRFLGVIESYEDISEIVTNENSKEFIIEFVLKANSDLDFGFMMNVIKDGTYSLRTITLKNKETGKIHWEKTDVQRRVPISMSNVKLAPGILYQISFLYSGGNTNKFQSRTRYDFILSSNDPGVNVSRNQNYVRTKTMTDDIGDKYMDQIEYIDGLGRSIETMQRGITPSVADLATFQEYDVLGLESNSWLAVSIPNNAGEYIDLEKVKKNIGILYPNETVAFSTSVYEASPLNRVIEQYGSGADWRKINNQRPIITEYLANTVSGVLSCAFFSVDGVGNATKLKKNNFYPANHLYVTKITDEDKNVSYEFKDKLGQVILRRQMVGTVQHDTYYVYDNSGNLCFVLSPLASDGLIPYNGSWDDINSIFVKQFAYIYRYDKGKRCTWKKLPGAEPIYYVYDKADRLIFSQDGEQRVKRPTKEWTFNKYDILGRLIISGIHKTNETHEALAAKCKDVVVKETSGTGSFGYSWSSITGIDPNGVLLVNHYDDYKHLLQQGSNFDTKLKYDEKAGYGKRYIHDALKEKTPKGILVGTRIKQLQSNGTISGEIATTMYYDNRGRLIQTHSTNHMGGVDSEYIAYNFTGQPTKKMHVHTPDGKTTTTEFYTYAYDHAGRLIDTKHKLNTGAETLIAHNEYDELGRLKTNKKGNNANLTTTYDYNIRSWTSKISSPLFTQNLYYNTVPSSSSVTPQYGGNVSAISWKVENEAERKYGFTYDGLSRLTHSAYDYKASGGNFSTSYSYDKHGNMMTHVQRGVKSKGVYEMVDNLVMSYNGNQLINVHNGGAGSMESTSAHFDDYSKDPNKTKVEYTYNANGAMTADLNKGSTIQYNSLNLPTVLTINNTKARGDIQYTYSATGQKLKTVHKEDINLARMPVVGTGTYTTPSWQTTTTDYVGNKIYEQVGSNVRVLKRILIDGGYYDAVKKKYFYYLTDHLGNNRVVAEANGTVAQKTHYYPFGMAFAEETVKDEGQKEQPYKYNGKELDRRLQLNTYDYSARYMDPAIGRFSSVDPLAEKYYSISPYAYVANNPLKYIDPDGKALNLVTGGIGAAISAGVNIYVQHKEGNLDWSSGKTWARIGIATGAGFVAGVTGNVAIAVAANASGNAADQFVSKGNIDAKEVGLAGGLTIAGSAAASVISKSGVIQSFSRGFGSTLSKNANKVEVQSNLGRGSLTTYSKEGMTPLAKDIENMSKVIGATGSQAGVESVNQTLSSSDAKNTDNANKQPQSEEDKKNGK